jgi:pimeloyl-ACP methyl ester carboxylesterase
MNIKQSAWASMVPVDDTALYVSDSGGSGLPVVYLNGAYADQSHWRRVIADLGSDYRHITYDERARGKSKRSADYSFEGMIRDLEAVLKARGVDRPLLVGWSLGGILAWHWIDRNPDRVLGAVIVDAFPVGVTGAAGHEAIRKMFRRWRLLLPIAARFGLAARMTADQHAEVNIELNEIGAAHPNLKMSAKVASNHTRILRKDSPAVAHGVREIAARYEEEGQARRACAPMSP